MADVHSLGIHLPLALPYLVSEGILPQHPAPHSYQWETYLFSDGGDQVEEEVLATKDCVVWSQGTFIRRAYRFELEGDAVVQAVLTNFPAAAAHLRRPVSNTNGADDSSGAPHTNGRIDWPNGADRQTKPPSTRPSTTTSRALVVFLKLKAHVYFLNGATYILDLPIEVERAFPAPCGVVVQRRPSQPQSLPPTPTLPRQPPNSFFSSQRRTSNSYLLSPTASRSLGSTQPSQPSPLGSNNRLDALFQDAFGAPAHSDEDNLAPLYSLVDPLSDFGVITYSLQHPKPRLSNRNKHGMTVEFEPLDAGEQIIYMSPRDELASDAQSDREPLILIATINNTLQTVTIWHAWYVNETSLASLMKQRAAHKAAKARRRSSFLSAGMGIGTATPAVRHREGTRESFATAGSVRRPGELAAPHAPPSSKKPTQQEEEDAMASQMDPDYQPGASQKAARDSRRISSLNSDVRASQNAATAGLAGPGGRRNTSFGGPNERRSFGHRKSRGSTPGSVFGRSLGPDDDLMDIDSSTATDVAESVESILRHMRATFEAAGADSIFGGVDGNFKRDLVVRKLHFLPKPSPASAATDTRIFTLADNVPRAELNHRSLNVYVHDGTTKAVTCIELRVEHRALWAGSESSPTVPIPVVTNGSRIGCCTDIMKLNHHVTEKILLADQGLIISPDHPNPCPLPDGAPYLSHRQPQPDLRSVAGTNSSHEVQPGPGPSKGAYTLAQTGRDGTFDEVALEVHHRRQIKLHPDDPQLEKLLRICQLVSYQHQAADVYRSWYNAHAWLIKHPENMEGTASNIEWVAFTTTVFGLVVPLINDSALASKMLSRKAVEFSSGSNAKFARRQHEKSKSGELAWQALLKQSQIIDAQKVFTGAGTAAQKDQLLPSSMALAKRLAQSGSQNGLESLPATTSATAMKLMLALHVFLEEQKLCTARASTQDFNALAAIVTQLGSCLGIASWSYMPGSYYQLEGVDEQDWVFVETEIAPLGHHQVPLMAEPVGIFQWFEYAMQTRSEERYPTLDTIAALGRQHPLTESFRDVCTGLTPRIKALSDILEETAGLTTDEVNTVQLMTKCGITLQTFETLPIAIAASFSEAIAKCEKQPPTTWLTDLLRLVGRDDLDINAQEKRHASLNSPNTIIATGRDIQAICSALEHHPHSLKTKEAKRHAVSQLLFSEDRRLVEAVILMHYNTPQVAECPKQPDWSDAYHLEQQKKLTQGVIARMVALPIGDALIHFDSQMPLLTDKYHLAGFSSSCLMQPMGQTTTMDRSALTEERINWAYFHAGVSAGLRISKSIRGIDTSWIAFNKPNDLTNRHAGLLLALGLNGHLRNLAKWLSFKYLTPKHSMTSVGLLLGLSASYMGTMDGLIARMLSVHITRMLPPGAAELNVSPVTQTAGLMGIGLLYYNTQHRRMSEIMLSEVEHMELEDPDSGPDALRVESYRLAAGFALGFINLGKGRDLRGLHGMYLPERLLAIAVGPRPVNAVHIFDRATAGAVAAIALVYMKSGDEAIARKIDIPDTEAQFDHVRPDVLMLRVMARHVIMWDDMIVQDPAQDGKGWIQESLPTCYKSRFEQIKTQSTHRGLKSSDIPFFNIATGLAWALSLKYAGSGNLAARDEILAVLDAFYMVQGGSGSKAFARVANYDTKLTRSTLHRCIDVLAVSAATVMAGTGDLQTFRYLRRLHGRTDQDTTYGSHLAAHLAIGVLFVGGGTYTLGTSDLAVASLICAFYPLYPTSIGDNHCHLQAFRHLWVFAAEARCLIVEDIDTQRPISLPIVVTLKDGSSKSMVAPGLLPELESIAQVQTNDPAYWRVTLDFAGNPQHLASFRKDQHIFVRRCPASEAHSSVFSATMSALSETPSVVQASSNMQDEWRSIFNLSGFKDLDKADVELILPHDLHSSIYVDERGTAVDDRLQLNCAVDTTKRDELWNLRLLFAWAERAKNESTSELKWIRSEVVETLKAKIAERQR